MASDGIPGNFPSLDEVLRGLNSESSLNSNPQPVQGPLRSRRSLSAKVSFSDDPERQNLERFREAARPFQSFTFTPIDGNKVGILFAQNLGRAKEKLDDKAENYAEKKGYSSYRVDTNTYQIHYSIEDWGDCRSEIVLRAEVEYG